MGLFRLWGKQMIVLPLYYTKEYKTKKSKTFIVNQNWYRNTNHFLSNEVKKYYHNLVEEQKEKLPVIDKTFKLIIKIYYKNPSSDPSNSIAVMEKFVLDGLIEAKIIKEDNVLHHLGTTWEVSGQDKNNPRVEIEIIQENI